MPTKFTTKNGRNGTIYEVDKTGRTSPDWSIGSLRSKLVSNGFGLLMSYAKRVDQAPTKNVDYCHGTGFDNLKRRDHREG